MEVKSFLSGALAASAASVVDKHLYQLAERLVPAVIVSTILMPGYLLSGTVEKTVVQSGLKLYGSFFALLAASYGCYKIKQSFSNQCINSLQDQFPASIRDRWNGFSETTKKVVLFVASIGLFVAARILTPRSTKENNIEENLILQLVTQASGVGKGFTAIGRAALKEIISLGAARRLAIATLYTAGIQTMLESIKDVPKLGFLRSYLGFIS